MNKISQCLFAGTLIGAGLCSAAIADVTINDSIHLIGTPIFTNNGTLLTAAGGDLEIHAIEFSVLSDDQVQLDLFSYLNLDTWFDSVIMLFTNDGNPLSISNQLAVNDDFTGTDLNGSSSIRDSFIDIFLTAGDYIVTVGAFNYGVGDADLGQGSGTVWGHSIDGIPTSGQYQLDIFGNVAVVPAPGVLALVGLGGLMGARRRR